MARVRQDIKKKYLDKRCMDFRNIDTRRTIYIYYHKVNLQFVLNIK